MRIYIMFFIMTFRKDNKIKIIKKREKIKYIFLS